MEKLEIAQHLAGFEPTVSGPEQQPTFCQEIDTEKYSEEENSKWRFDQDFFYIFNDYFI